MMCKTTACARASWMHRICNKSRKRKFLKMRHLTATALPLSEALGARFYITPHWVHWSYTSENCKSDVLSAAALCSTRHCCYRLLKNCERGFSFPSLKDEKWYKWHCMDFLSLNENWERLESVYSGLLTWESSLDLISVIEETKGTGNTELCPRHKESWRWSPLPAKCQSKRFSNTSH